MAQAMNTLMRTDRVPFSVAINSEGTKRMLERTLADKRTRERFVTSVVAAVSASPLLAQCEPASILSAALQGNALGLAPSPQLGQFYMIPYGTKATFQMGVNGWKQLAIRSGQYRDIDALVVKEGEYKGRDRATGKPVFEFVEDAEEWARLPAAGYLASFELLNGFRKVEYMSRAEVVRHAARYSKAFNIELFERYEKYLETGEGMTDRDLRQASSPWYESFDGMAQKTVLIRLLKRWGVLSIDMQTAMEREDDAVEDGAGVLMEQPIQTESEKAEEASETPEQPKAAQTEAPASAKQNSTKQEEDDFFD